MPRLRLASLSLFALLLAAMPASAQEAEREIWSPGNASNAIYLEIGGSGFIGSVNYERWIVGGLKARVGGSIFSYPLTQGNPYTGLIGGLYAELPVLRERLPEGGRFEVGFAATRVLRGETDEGFTGIRTDSRITLLSPQLAYTHRRLRGGRYIRFAITPLFYADSARILDLEDRTVIPLAGLSIGQAF
jgi:hypothetical protein